ncbi:DNA topoisomerase IB [Nocardioides daeguensis]|uniref:DNA topoisomerase IB n=1 Tax=Nocardioides daeguensis TaxID=908359 RepID=A0ABP6V395_9ACTN|nr:DNA topoisomerase IB [Nocardioides daeguensis]MBV6727103.1 DNA topoisomerase IB [Nocardioides daeguensis]MCR1771494.1 DNA topoisomerase IB [Nocardioides daeguensis]
MARLRRTSPEEPGWTRRRAGRGFVHVGLDGRPLGAEDAARCRALVIPPAWNDVWICPRPNGHLQAVGTDAAGRRQYLYHPDWVEQRAAQKHERVVGLGRRLARVRERVLADLADDDLGPRATCALAVRLIDLGCFRIGNDVYAEEYGSFGLTTLERQHVRRTGDVLVFEFTGKSGIEHHVEIDDPVVVEALDRRRRRRRQDPRLLDVTGTDVNDYLREVSGLDVTAKDFRTWHGTVLAAAALADAPGPDASRTARKRAVVAAMREVADFLGNTPALARSAYVDPRVVDAYEEGRTIRARPGARQEQLERATLRLVGGR